jgi:glycosyltransferase involved in cell wall biosynthesis
MFPFLENKVNLASDAPSHQARGLSPYSLFRRMNQAGDKVRIGINLLFLRPGRIGGGETYARGLLDALVRLNPPHDFFVFLNSEAYPTFAELDASSNFKRIHCDAPSTAALRHLWEQMRFRNLCRTYQLDILHSLGNVTPLSVPCLTAVTIHDLLYKVEPATLPFARRHVLGRMVTASAQHCDLILTVSKTSEEHIIRYLGIAPEKIHVTPEGPGQSLDAESSWEEVRARYQVPEPYFLTVGTAAHKRLDRVIEATHLLHAKRKFPASLVTTGPLGYVPPSNGVAKHFGYVPAAVLASLYKHALAVICFSDMEGFGLTVLEAMAMGTPVLASNAAALPEVLGNGGLLVEHGDSAALSEAMWKIATDKQLQAEMRQRGFERVSHFSWDNCARETVRAYDKLLGF